MNMIQGTFLFIIGDQYAPFKVQLFDSNAGSGTAASATNIRAIASGVNNLRGVMNIRPSIYVFVTGNSLTVLIGLDYT
jgi:hypothetical protein